MRWSAVALALCGCPGGAEFEAVDVVTDVPVVDTHSADETLGADTSAGDGDATTCTYTCTSDMHAGRCQPASGACSGCACASASQCVEGLCAVRDDYEAIAATGDPRPLGGTVDVNGVARLVTLVPAGADKLALSQLTYDGSSWSANTLLGELAGGDLVQLAVGRDLDDEVHLLTYREVGFTTATDWLHDDGKGWASLPFLDGRGCQAPRFVRADDALRAGCLYGSQLRIVRLGPDGWVLERTLDDLDAPPGWTLDRDHFPRVAFLQPTGTLRYAAWNGVRWFVAPAGSYTLADAGSNRVVIALDDQDRVHLVHQALVDDHPVLIDTAADGADGWDDVEVARGTLRGLAHGELLAMERDAKGRLHLVYRDDNELVYRRWDGEWFDPQRAVTNLGEPGYAALFLDDGGLAHVAYANDQHELRWWTPRD